MWPDTIKLKMQPKRCQPWKKKVEKTILIWSITYNTYSFFSQDQYIYSVLTVYSIWSFAVFVVRTLMMIARIYKREGCNLKLMLSTLVDPILYILWLPWNFGNTVEGPSTNTVPKNAPNIIGNGQDTIGPIRQNRHPAAPEEHEIYPLLWVFFKYGSLWIFYSSSPSNIQNLNTNNNICQ